ncbi:unnamed protein product, partial [Allacma fusca]
MEILTVVMRKTLNSGLVCNATWDENAVACWPAVPAGDRLSFPCSEVMRYGYRVDSLDLKGIVSRNCSQNGTWGPTNQTDYNACLESLDENLT